MPHVPSLSPFPKHLQVFTISCFCCFYTFLLCLHFSWNLFFPGYLVTYSLVPKEKNPFSSFSLLNSINFHCISSIFLFLSTSVNFCISDFLFSKCMCEGICQFGVWCYNFPLYHGFGLEFSAAIWFCSAILLCLGVCFPWLRCSHFCQRYCFFNGRWWWWMEKIRCVAVSLMSPSPFPAFCSTTPLYFHLLEATL